MTKTSSFRFISTKAIKYWKCVSVHLLLCTSLSIFEKEKKNKNENGTECPRMRPIILILRIQINQHCSVQGKTMYFLAEYYWIFAYPIFWTIEWKTRRIQNIYGIIHNTHTKRKIEVKSTSTFNIIAVFVIFIVINDNTWLLMHPTFKQSTQYRRI